MDGVILTREAILSRAALPVREVAVPAWGGCVRVRGLSARQRMDLADKAGQASASLAALAGCVIDADGNALFSVEELGTFDLAALDPLIGVMLELSGLGAGVAEAVEKN